MHFAYPPRKSSNPPPLGPMSTRLPQLRRSRLKTTGLVLLALVGALYLLVGHGKPSPYHERVPSGTPGVVLVTVVDQGSRSGAYIDAVKENRQKYAALHGYEAMVADVRDYDTRGAPASWAKIVAMRHAMSKYPDCKFIWYLDQDAYIMEPTRSLEEAVLDSKKLERLMIKDYPVVPPDSIIKTFSHLRPQDADFVVGQDKEGLVHKSMVVRNGAWAKFFVETWFDPLYRSYNFQKAERHALEHIVQWHPTILSKLALVPQRILSSYSRPGLGDGYQDGDFVVMLEGCAPSGEASCDTEAAKYAETWRGKLGAR